MHSKAELMQHLTAALRTAIVARSQVLLKHTNSSLNHPARTVLKQRLARPVWLMPAKPAQQPARPRLRLAITALFSSLIISLNGGCALPTIEERTTSVSLAADEARNTALGQAVAPLAERHPGESGVFAMGDPHESFAVRVLIARAANRTLDVQYYIWHGDTTGTLLLATLHEAAERGVRIRLLLDDNGTVGIDARLASLNMHPNIEVRLFNPFLNRRFKLLGYTYDFFRLNRRMHNKSFTADAQATVIGGRNVGDEYFGAASDELKVDLDALLVGPVAEEVARDFDLYWASASSYPIEDIVTTPEPVEQERILNAIQEEKNSPAAQDYLDAIRESKFIGALLNGDPGLLWSKVRMVTDDPAKGLGAIKGKGLLINQLDNILAHPEHSLVLVSPYFVPTRAGTDFFVAMAERGVDVRILTNSLEATDVLPVHAGYVTRRKALLKAGVRLYEMKRLSSVPEKKAGVGYFGSSASSLHAKTFAIDGERVFIGSFNFDPRSMHLNTELGFVIENPLLARDIETTIRKNIPDRAYEVRLDENGKLYWLDHRGEDTLRLDTEPNSSWLKRAVISVLTFLPIEWLL